MKTATETNNNSLSKNPTNVLRDIYLSRREKNTAYSLNSFARDLGISKSFLSRIFSGERPLSMKLATQISTALDFNETQTKSLLLAVIQASTKNSKISRKVKDRLEQELVQEPEEVGLIYTTVEIERFKAMASWYHLAIINLVTLKDFQSDIVWISKQLGISKVEASEAIDRLLALGLMHEENGKLKRSTKNNNIKTNKSEYAVRNFHGQMIEKAKAELKNTDAKSFNRRLINGITFSCGVDQIELIKEKIDEFQDEILKLASAGEREELYQMNVQYFPLTKNNLGEKNET